MLSVSASSTSQQESPKIKNLILPCFLVEISYAGSAGDRGANSLANGPTVWSDSTPRREKPEHFDIQTEHFCKLLDSALRTRRDVGEAPLFWPGDAI